jgi:hypothetical protein
VKVTLVLFFKIWGSLIKVHKLFTCVCVVIWKSKFYYQFGCYKWTHINLFLLFSHNAHCKHLHQVMCFKVHKNVYFARWTFFGSKYFKIVWERGSRTCRSTKHFTCDKVTYNVSLFSGFCWDGCKSDPRIAPKRVSPWHLSIVKEDQNLFNRINKNSVWKFEEYILFQYWVDANNVGHKFKI